MSGFRRPRAGGVLAVEHSVDNRGVRGSSPLSANHGAVAQPGALDSTRGGREIGTEPA